MVPQTHLCRVCFLDPCGIQDKAINLDLFPVALQASTVADGKPISSSGTVVGCHDPGLFEAKSNACGRMSLGAPPPLAWGLMFGTLIVHAD